MRAGRTLKHPFRKSASFNPFGFMWLLLILSIGLLSNEFLEILLFLDHCPYPPAFSMVDPQNSSGQGSVYESLNPQIEKCLYKPVAFSRSRCAPQKLPPFQSSPWDSEKQVFIISQEFPDRCQQVENSETTKMWMLDSWLGSLTWPLTYSQLAASSGIWDSDVFLKTWQTMCHGFWWGITALLT